MRQLLPVVLLLALSVPAFAYRNGQMIRLSEESDSFEVVLDRLAADRTTATIVIDESVTLAEDKAVPENITLDFCRGNGIALNSHVLAINGIIKAGPYKIFDCGKVSFDALAHETNKAKVTGNPNVDCFYPQWWGADDTGTEDASIGFQAAINLVKHPGHGRSFGFSRTIRIHGKFLIQNPLNVTKVIGVKFVGVAGKNQYNIVYANTGGVLFDCTGSHHMGFRGFYIRYKPETPNPSNCAILLASCKDPGYTECLYNEIAYMYIELLTREFKGKYGTVGVCGIGTEECTFLSNQIYADTPWILSAYYNIVKDEIKNPYAEIMPGHSTGINTFSGENMVVAFNNRSYNLVLNRTNALSLGNMYFASMTWSKYGDVGNNLTCIQYVGSNDLLTGNLKIEGKTSIFDIVDNANVGCLDINAELTGTANMSDRNYALINILGHPKYGAAKINGLRLCVAYGQFEAVGGWPPPAKSLFGPKKIVDSPNPRLEFNNVTIETSQISTYLEEPLPAQLAKVARNVKVGFRDRTFVSNDDTVYLLTNQKSAVGDGKRIALRPVPEESETGGLSLSGDVGGTYLVVNKHNTQSNDGTEPWYDASSAVKDNLWGYVFRGAENEWFTASPLEDVPPLKTTISHLEKGKTYEVRVIYSSDVANSYSIAAGLSPDSLKTYYRTDGVSKETGKYNGRIYQMKALVGTAKADNKGEISVYVNKGIREGKTTTWYYGLSYKAVN